MYEAALERLRQALNVGAARHIDVDARVERERGGLDEVRRNAMIEQLRDGVVVADQTPSKPRLPAASLAAACALAVIGTPATSMNAGMIAAAPAATAAANGGR